MSETHPAETETRNSEATLRLLVEAGGRLSATLDLQTLYATLQDVVTRAMRCDGFLISSYHPRQNEIRCEFAWVGGNLLDPTTLPPVPLSEQGGMQSQVIVTGKPLIFNDVAERVREEGDYYEVTSEGEITEMEEVEEPTTKCAAFVPIKIDDVVLGVLQVMSEKAGAYDADQLQLLEGLAHQLAIAQQNARLFERARKEIAERERAEHELRQAEAALLQTLDAMPHIAWSLTSDGTTNFVNRRLIEYGGGDDGARFTGANGWANMVHPEDRPGCFEQFQVCVANGSTWDCELRLLRHDGMYRWHLSRMVPIRDTHGAIVRWFGTSTDIHDLKDAEEMLVVLNEDLERRVEVRTAELRGAIRELEGFTYSVSHDLRGPLRAISATSGILLAEANDVLNDEMRELLRRQSASASRLGTLIDDLLRLSRVSRSEMELTQIDLSLIAEEIGAELETRGWPTTLSLQIEKDLVTDGDKQLVQLVMLNLIENAMKFSPNGGVVSVGKTEEGAFFVRDQGIGFDPKYIDKIWQPFERLVGDHEFPGTGIGLANVKRIVERHGGRAWAESLPENGATFYFTLREEKP